MERSRRKLKILISLFVAALLSLGLVFAFAFSNSGSYSSLTASANAGVTDTGNRARHARRTGIVNFNSLNTQTVGRMDNPVGANYNMRNRGPENSSQGAALAFTDFHDTGTQSGTRVWTPRWSSLQVWVSVGGELNQAIQAETINTLNLDLNLALGALTANNSGSSENSGRWGTTVTYLDISLNHIADTGLSTPGGGSDHVNAAGQLINFSGALLTPGDIWAGPRARIATGNGNRENAFGLTQGVQHLAGHNSWGLRQQSITIQYEHLPAIAQQGGFFIRMFSYASNWTSSTWYPFTNNNHWVQVANVLEGVRLTPVPKTVPPYTVPSMQSATYLDTLDSIGLPYSNYGQWEWLSPTNAVGAIGVREHFAVFRPFNRAIHLEVIRPVQISIAQRQPEPTIPSGLQMPYGERLSSVAFPSYADGVWEWVDPQIVALSTIGQRFFDARFIPNNPNMAMRVFPVPVEVLDRLPCIFIANRQMIGNIPRYTFEFFTRTGATSRFLNGVWFDENSLDLSDPLLNPGLNTLVLSDFLDRTFTLEIYLDFSKIPYGHHAYGFTTSENFLDNNYTISDTWGRIEEISGYAPNPLTISLYNHDGSLFSEAHSFFGTNNHSLPMGNPLAKTGFVTDGRWFLESGEEFIFGYSIVVGDISLEQQWSPALISIDGNFGGAVYGQAFTSSVAISVENNAGGEFYVEATDGELPPGATLSINAQTGIITLSGVVAAANLYGFNFTLRATNLLSESYTERDFNFVVVHGMREAIEAVSIISRTSSEIVVEYIEDAEYRLNNGEWQQSNVFASLTPATSYIIHIRLRATGNQLASPAVELIVRTRGALSIENAAGAGAYINGVYFEGLEEGDYLPTPTSPGFSFVEWQDSEGNILTRIDCLDENVELVAIWELEAVEYELVKAESIFGGMNVAATVEINDGINYEFMWSIWSGTRWLPIGSNRSLFVFDDMLLKFSVRAVSGELIVESVTEIFVDFNGYYNGEGDCDDDYDYDCDYEYGDDDCDYDYDDDCDYDCDYGDDDDCDYDCDYGDDDCDYEYGDYDDCDYDYEYDCDYDADYDCDYDSQEASFCEQRSNVQCIVDSEQEIETKDNNYELISQTASQARRDNISQEASFCEERSNPEESLDCFASSQKDNAPQKDNPPIPQPQIPTPSPQPSNPQSLLPNKETAYIETYYTY